MHFPLRESLCYLRQHIDNFKNASLITWRVTYAFLISKVATQGSIIVKATTAGS